MSIRNFALGSILGISALLFNLSYYTINNAEQAIILRVGEPKHVEKEPGLHFKMPFVDQVQVFSKKIMHANLIEKEMISQDQKKYIISSIIKYKINDIQIFYETLRSYDHANTIILNITESAVRNQIGKITLSDLLSEKRLQIIHDIQAQIEQEGIKYGLQIYDFRINRTDLPEQNAKAVYERMISDRAKEVALIRTDGEKQQTILQSQADLDYQKLITEGKITAANIRAQAVEYQTEKYASLCNDAELITTYANIQAQENILGNSTNITIPSNSKVIKDVFNK